MRKTITVHAEIPELGIRKTFTLSVGPDGTVRPEHPNCMAYGYRDNPVVSVEIATDRAKLIDFYERR